MGHWRCVNALATANCLHDFDFVTALQSRVHVRTTGYDLHIDGHSGAFAVGNAQSFE